MNSVPVMYIGQRPSKGCAHVIPGCNLVWAPGQIHFVPANDAVALTKFTDAWVVANEADLNDPSKIGFVIDPDSAPVESDEQRQERLEAEAAAIAALPNLEPLTKDSISQFAKRNFGIDLDVTAMKKSDMLKAIRDVASSRSASAKLETPGTVAVAVELPEPEPVVVTVPEEPGMRVQGSIDLPAGPVVVPSFTAQEPDVKPSETPVEPPPAPEVQA